MEWAIGKGYDLFRPGTGKLILPGEKIAWDQHIHAVGEEITAGSEIGIWFYKKGEEPQKRSYLTAFTGLRTDRFLDIPPNSLAQTEGFTVLKENTLIENFQPHFHLRGKSMQVEAILPDGSSQIISYVGNFNFNWMTNYIYADDAAPVFPKGTVIHVTAWYDNTKGNKNNPDPEQWVGYGDRTVDEMAHAGGRDPYRLRRALLSGKPEHLAVLDAAAIRARWDSPPPTGVFRGIALAEACESICALFLVVSIVLIAAEAIARNAFATSFQITDEVCGYLLVALTFLSMSVAEAHGAFHRVELVQTRLSFAARLISQMVFDFISLVASALVTWQLYRLAANSWRAEDVAPTPLQTPLWLPQSAMAIGMLLLCLALLRTMVTKARVLRRGDRS